MATPVSADRFLAALRAEGLKVVEVGDWKNRNRNHKGPWGPVNGVMLHHTVTGPKVNGVTLCRDGYASLPGPLCHGVIRRDGSVHLVGYGRTNHAGGGDPDVLSAVIRENYGDRPPTPNVGNDDGVDGNAHFIGFECENDGEGEPWPAVQIEAMVRASAAVCRIYDWGAKSAIAHKEWSDDKSDPNGPGFPGMTAMRVRIDERLAHAANWSRTATTTPPKTPAAPATSPSGATTVTAPNMTVLGRLADLTVQPGQELDLYWDAEWSDPLGQHGAGGKTVITNSDYSAVINVISSTGAVDIRPTEEDAAGAKMGAGIFVRASQGGAVPVNGGVNNRLVFTVKNPGTTAVTVGELRLVLFAWPH